MGGNGSIDGGLEGWMGEGYNSIGYVDYFGIFEGFCI